MHARNSSSPDAGFSLIELMIAMTVTLVVMAIASTLLAQSLNVRTREDRRSEALGDVQRALNIMSREIANSGCGFLSGQNGIIAGDSDATSIRLRTNLNAHGSGSDNDVSDANEDVKYRLYTDAGGRSYIVRYDVNSNLTTVVANRIDALSISYLNAAGATTTPANAAKVTISLSVNLPQVGMPGAPGFQPATTVPLASDVVLRKAVLTTY